jgi:hypothetical protein
MDRKDTSFKQWYIHLVGKCHGRNIQKVDGGIENSVPPSNQTNFYYSSKFLSRFVDSNGWKIYVFCRNNSTVINVGPPADWVKINVLRTVSTSYLQVLTLYCLAFFVNFCLASSSSVTRVDLIQFLQYISEVVGSPKGPTATVEV